MSVLVASHKTKLSYASKDGYRPGGESTVEVAGYRTMKQRVDELRLAGDRLLIQRALEYEFPDGVVPDDLMPNPAVSGKHLDLIDAQELLDRVNARIRADIARLAEQAELDKGSGSAPVVPKAAVEERSDDKAADKRSGAA